MTRVMQPRAPDSGISLPTSPPINRKGSPVIWELLRDQTPSQPALPTEHQRLHVAHLVTSSLATAIPYHRKDIIPGVASRKSVARVLLSTIPEGQRPAPTSLQGLSLHRPPLLTLE